MRFATRLVVVVSAAALLGGCARTYYVNTIAQTPENLQAFRECQRTFATAIGYDQEGANQLKRSCLSTVEWATTEPLVSPMGGVPAPPPGCQQLEQVNDQLYVLCQ